MKSILFFLTSSIFFLCIMSCEEEEKSENHPKTYFDYAGFITDGLVAYYPLNGDALDSSGNRNNGIISGASSGVDRFGDSLASFLFDGADDFIRIPNASQLNGNEGTICFWVRVSYSEEDTLQAIISKADAERIGYVISVYDPTYYWWSIRDTSGYIESGSDIGANFWEEGRYFFLSVTFTENSTAYYFEGELIKSETYTPEIIFNYNYQDVYIGKSLVSYYAMFRGEIDDLLFYNRALTESEIYQLYDWKNL